LISDAVYGFRASLFFAFFFANALSLVLKSGLIPWALSSSSERMRTKPVTLIRLGCYVLELDGN